MSRSLVTPAVTTAPTTLASRTRRALGNETGLVLVGNILARALGFAFPVLVARLVSRPDFGLVYFFINTGFFVGEIVLTGFPTALTRQVAAATGARNSVEIGAAILGGLPFYGIAVIAAIVLGLPATADPALVIIVVTGLTIDAYYFALLRGLHSFRLLIGYRVGANAAQIVLVLLVAALGAADVTLIVWIYAFVYLIPIVIIEVLFAPLRRAAGRMSAPTAAAIARLARFAVPALISGVAYACLIGLDVYVIRLVAPAALPEYSAARAISLPMTMIPFGIGVVLMPRVASSGNLSPRLLFDAVGLAAGFAALAVVGYLVLGGAVVGVVYPATLSGAAGVAPMLATAFGILGIYSVLGAWWFGIGRPAVASACLSVGATVTIASHMVLTARFGAVGAAASIGLGAAVALLLLAGRTMTRLRA